MFFFFTTLFQLFSLLHSLYHLSIFQVFSSLFVKHCLQTLHVYSNLQLFPDKIFHPNSSLILATLNH